jgi:hypothetical protein
MAKNEMMNMFTLLETELKGGGKQRATEPYQHFEDSLNEIYDYVKDVFQTNEGKKKEHALSINKMDEPCDCPDKYKAEKMDMNPSIYMSNSSYTVYTLEPIVRKEEEIIKKTDEIS